MTQFLLTNPNLRCFRFCYTKRIFPLYCYLKHRSEFSRHTCLCPILKACPRLGIRSCPSQLLDAVKGLFECRFSVE